MQHIRLLTTLLLTLAFVTAGVAQRIYRLYDYSTKKYGLRDDDWNIVAPTIYDDIEPNLDSIFAAKINGKMVLFNGDGSIRVPPVYQQIVAHFNSFHQQYGFAAVTKDDKKPNTWGMITSSGQVILPEKYQYIRALNPNLLAAIVYPDTMIQFFDGTGKPLYQRAGRNLEPSDIDQTCYGIKGRDRNTRYYRTEGSLVTPEQPKLGLWTDGTLTIRYESVPNGRTVPKVGVSDATGQWVVPARFHEIRLGLKGHFICTSNDSATYRPVNSAVYDHSGQVIIPEGRYSIRPWGQVYLLFSRDKDVVGVTDASGRELLPVVYDYQQVRASGNDYDERIANSHPDRYVMLSDDSRKHCFLVRDDGRIIRPPDAYYMSYFADNQPFVGRMHPDNAEQTAFMAFDIAGQPLLKRTWKRLNYTDQPGVLIGYQDNNCDFIYLDRPDTTSTLRYQQLSYWPNRYYCGQRGATYDLYDASLRLVLSTTTIQSIQQPDRQHFEAFRREKHLPGRLIAIGRSPQMDYEHFIGINDQGASHAYKIEQ
jgi:WG containing repeat